MENLTDSRQNLQKQFLQHDWFKNTDSQIQTELLNLPEDFSGFLDDLVNRPDEIGEVDVLRLLKLSYGNYLILSVFEVRSNITNQVFTYEYVSWKTGDASGTRGIIFLESEGKITHFLAIKTHKFSTASMVYDSLGGLFFKVLNNKPQNLPKKIEEEICYHLGVEKLTFKKVIELGKMNSDYGLTNNASSLFAAIIDISELSNLIDSKLRPTHKPIGFEIRVIHISEFGEYINKIEDSYFLSAVARLLTHKEIELEY